MMTYREAAEKLKLAEQRAQHNAEQVARWRAKFPHATCNDATALLLAQLWLEFGGGR